MLFRSALVDVRPFRTGLVVWVAGLMIVLGSDHGGAVGSLLGGGLSRLVGETGSAIVGVTLLVAGSLLLTGASAGAILRRSGHAVRVSARSVDEAMWPQLSVGDEVVYDVVVGADGRCTVREQSLRRPATA